MPGSPTMFGSLIDDQKMFDMFETLGMEAKISTWELFRRVSTVCAMEDGQQACCKPEAAGIALRGVLEVKASP